MQILQLPYFSSRWITSVRFRKKKHMKQEKRPKITFVNSAMRHNVCVYKDGHKRIIKDLKKKKMYFLSKVDLHFPHWPEGDHVFPEWRSTFIGLQLPACNVKIVLKTILMLLDLFPFFPNPKLYYVKTPCRFVKHTL